MKIEIAEHGRMSESGSSLLRLIQNQDIPLLDLIVRESIQNSLDATNNMSNSVDVSISVGEFRSNELNRHFERIENGLNKRFPGNRGKYSFISFRDSNTVGLTGPVRYDDVRNNEFGNLLKLVYEICKPQQNEGAGGSWGLGKTIYFRLGIGLVIYYSRINENGKYKSRLAACLVEDETKKDSLIPHAGGVKRGIAWWGKADRPGLRARTTVPLDNEKEIERILSVFDISPYKGEQTGTTIIIPYIDKEALLAEVYAKNDDAEKKPYWAYSIEEYIKVSIQRWYAPRLMNPNYAFGSYLSVWINGTKLKIPEMLPLFRLIRDLYILTQGGSKEDTSLINEQSLDYTVANIDLRGVLETTTAGWLAYGKFTTEQLLMNPPHNNKSPYQQISNISTNMEGGNGPIIMYTRRPGMIVGYDYDGVWTHQMPKTGPEEFVIGLFVANTENTLKSICDPHTGAAMSLEEYIRQGEKADHASWTDRNIQGTNPRIITNVQKNIINKIRKQYTEVVTDTIERKNIGLGHALADLLLPSEDFGNAATIPSGAEPVVYPKPRTNKSGLKIEEMHFENGQVVADVDIFLRDRKCEMSLEIITDYKRYEADLWEEEFTKEFPIEFSQIKLEYFSGGRGRPSVELLTLVGENKYAENSKVKVEYRSSKLFTHNCYLILTPKNFKGRIKGSVTFTVFDPLVRGSIEIKEIE